MAAPTTFCAESAGGPDQRSRAALRLESVFECLSDAVQSGNLTDILGPEYKPILEMLEGVSRSRGLQGFTPSETATFVFSFKQPLFSVLRKSRENDPAELMENILAADLLLDKLGLHEERRQGEEGRPRRRHVDCDREIQLNPKLAIAYSLRSGAKAEKGDFEGAIADCGQAIRLNPKSAFAYYNRGKVTRKKGDLDGAMADFNQAIELDPKNDATYISRGITKAKKGDLDGAMADYNQAIKLNPKSDSAFDDRGNVNAKGGRSRGSVG
jgi:tetratricopeptide (TPR) repeat protein